MQIQPCFVMINKPQANRLEFRLNDNLSDAATVEVDFINDTPGQHSELILRATVPIEGEQYATWDNSNEQAKAIALGSFPTVVSVQ